MTNWIPAFAGMTTLRIQPGIAGAPGFDLELDWALMGQFCDLAPLRERFDPPDFVHLFTIRRIPAT